MVVRGRVLLSLLLSLCLIFIFIYVVRADDPRFTTTLTLPFNNTLDLTGNMTFYYNVTDLDNNVTNCSLIFDASTNQTNSYVTESFVNYFNLNNINFGFHNWSVQCVNNLGNVSSSETRVLQVYHDTSAPIVVLESPTDPTTYSDGTVNFTFHVTDNGWMSNCSLYTNKSGSWQIEQTNFFVQQNTSLTFEVTNLSDDTTFKWNVACYDFGLPANFAWGSSNRTVTIDNHAPSYSTISTITMNEDDVAYLNLSLYFSDSDSDDLTYTVSNASNVLITIDNATNIATIEPDLNWYGNRTLVFSAFDDMNSSVSSGSITLSVAQQGDTAPHKIQTSPSSGYNDTMGITYITCNAADDYNLTSISLYTDIEGNWSLNQRENTDGENVSITNVSVTFAVYTLTEQINYKWACKFEDNNSHIVWSGNSTVNVSIIPMLSHDINNYTINHVDHNRTLLVSYSNHLNNTIFLDNLTVFLSNGSIYFSKNSSQLTSTHLDYLRPPVITYVEKIRIKYQNIFNGDYDEGNSEQLNLTLYYHYGNNSRKVSTTHMIEIKPALEVPVA